MFLKNLCIFDQLKSKRTTKQNGAELKHISTRRRHEPGRRRRRKSFIKCCLRLSNHREISGDIAPMHKTRPQAHRNPHCGETDGVPTGARSQRYLRALARGLGIQNLWDWVQSEEGIDRRAAVLCCSCTQSRIFCHKL